MSTILRLQLIFDNTFDSLCLYISVRQRYQRDYIIANEKSPQSVAGRQIEKTVCTTTSHLCRTPDLNKMEKSLKKNLIFYRRQEKSACRDWQRSGGKGVQHKRGR